MEIRPIYILVGAPGSGKSWVAAQLGHKFHYVANDSFIGKGGDLAYMNAIAHGARTGAKPVLCDVPFSLSKLQEPLERLGFYCFPVFIIESPEVTKARYEKREGKPIPKGHITRIKTYLDRAIYKGLPHGTSAEMLQYLRRI